MVVRILLATTLGLAISCRAIASDKRSPECQEDIPSTCSKEMRIVSYEWLYVHKDGQTSLPPPSNTFCLFCPSEQSSTRASETAIPSTSLSLVNDTPILKKDSSRFVSNLDVLVSLEMLRPTFWEALAEVNRQINCGILTGTQNKLVVQRPMYTRLWFPEGFRGVPIAEKLEFNSLPATEAITKIFALSPLNPRFIYINANYEEPEKSEEVALSLLTIDFFDGTRLVSRAEHGLTDHDYVPPWVKEEEILSEGEENAWYESVHASNNPKQPCDNVSHPEL